MKYRLIIDDSKEESIVITAHEKSDLILEIEKIISASSFKLLGYKEDEIYPLEINDVYCFYTSDNKIIAKTKNDEYIVKERIYQLEENTKYVYTVCQCCGKRLDGIVEICDNKRIVCPYCLSNFIPIEKMPK